MVLGGGLLPDGGLPEWVARRLDGALDLYRQQQQQAEWQGGNGSTLQRGTSSSSQRWPCSIVLLGAGTPHKQPVIDSAGYVLHESTAYATYLMQRGVPAAHLLKEIHSYDTVGNGYFSLLIHALPAGWRQVCSAS